MPVSTTAGNTLTLRVTMIEGMNVERWNFVMTMEDWSKTIAKPGSEVKIQKVERA